MTAAIWWLASYPKSGNTWLRTVLASLISKRAVDINGLAFLGDIASKRRTIDGALGIATADLSPRQIADLRPRAYEVWAGTARRRLYCKVHDMCATTPAGEPLFPVSASLGAVYVVRDPRAVAVSSSHYYASSLDQTIARMNDPDAALASSDMKLNLQVAQTLGRWSAHVESWLSAPFPVHVVRYEDMIAAPHDAFASIARFLQLPATRETIDLAVEAASFPRLQSQEREVGYLESPSNKIAFFREGRADGWRSVLTRLQADTLIADHGAMMRRLGYDTTLAPLEA